MATFLEHCTESVLGGPKGSTQVTRDFRLTTVSWNAMAAAQKRVRVLGDVVTPRLVEATSEIVVAKHGAHDERLRPKGVSNTLDPSPTLRPTKLVPENLPELIPSLSPVPASDAATNPHVVVQLARRCWDGWLRKHRALTNSEGVYASLLTDARRCDILTDELSMVNDILLKQRACETDALAGTDSSGSSADRASAHDGLRALIVAKAQEAIAGYKERTNNYHCGHTCKLTGFLRISRSPGDMDDTLRLFEGRVGAETEEALDQAQEVIVAPDLKILSETLSRRVEFWESEVEKSWVCWTAHSSEFHEACEAIAEDWREFHAQMLEVVARVQKAPTPSNSTSTIMFIMPALNMQEVQAQKRWEEMHQVCTCTGRWRLLAAQTHARQFLFRNTDLVNGASLVSASFFCLSSHWSLLSSCTQTPGSGHGGRGARIAWCVDGSP